MNTEIKTENKWTIYWLDGHRSIVTGETIEKAFNNAGYGGGAINAIDWYTPGITYTHDYDREKKEWVVLPVPYKDFTLYLLLGQRELVAGLDVQHAIERAGLSELQTKLNPVQIHEEGITDSYIFSPQNNLWIKREEFANFLNQLG